MPIEFEPAYNRLPLASLPTRLGAFVIDFLACFLLAQLIRELLGLSGGFWLQFIFMPIWLSDRALVNGQSLGRWAMSLKVVNMNYGKPTGTLALLKREGLILAFLLLIINSLDSSGMITSLTIFAPIPLIVELVFASADTLKRQTIHDRLSESIVVFTRKGLQLDLKLSKWINIGFTWTSQIVKKSQLKAKERKPRRSRLDTPFSQPNNFSSGYDPDYSKYNEYDAYQDLDDSSNQDYENQSPRPRKKRSPRRPRR
jgi:uncharacterized RDD family membrane protein YckC